MSVSKAIQFRNLSSQLNQAERTHFMARLSDDIIDKSLFRFFMHESNGREADSTNNLLTNIIRARKKKPTAIPTAEDLKLDTLPKPLIGAAASFLPQNDYISLSKCNRFVFLGCNSPNLLQELDLIQIKDYSQINLALFPSAKTFKFSLSKFNQFSLPLMGANTVMNEVTCMILDGEEKDIFEISPFMTQSWINTNNITKIRFQRFGNNTLSLDNFDSAKFMKLLTKFPNIQYCSFFPTKASVEAAQFQMLWPNLRGLELFMCDHNASQTLISKFGNNLDFLSFVDRPDLDLSSVNFSKLQQLRLVNPRKKSLNHISDTAVNLKKLDVQFLMVNATTLPQNETKQCIIKLITNCKGLEYIAFGDRSKDGTYFGSILEGIEKGLFQTKKRKRKQLKIKIQLDIAENETFKPTEFMFNISNIINWLQMSEINDFMFILAITSHNMADANELKKECEYFSNVNVEQFRNGLVISNKNCELTLEETWEMPFNY